MFAVSKGWMRFGEVLKLVLLPRDVTCDFFNKKKSEGLVLYYSKRFVVKEVFNIRLKGGQG